MKRLLTMAAAAAVGLFVAGTAAYAVPPCNNGKPGYQQCNPYPWGSRACKECRSCAARGGVYKYLGNGERFAGICKLAMPSAKPILKPVKPGKPGTVPDGTPKPMEKY